MSNTVTWRIWMLYTITSRQKCPCTLGGWFCVVGANRDSSWHWRGMGDLCVYGYSLYLVILASLSLTVRTQPSAFVVSFCKFCCCVCGAVLSQSSDLMAAGQRTRRTWLDPDVPDRLGYATENATVEGWFIPLFFLESSFRIFGSVSLQGVAWDNSHGRSTLKIIKKERKWLTTVPEAVLDTNKS